MSGRWANSTRGSRLPPDWHKRRARTKRAADGRCQHVDPDGQRCTWVSPPHGTGQPDGHADHILNEAAGGTDDQDNLQWLCPPHHYAKSSREGTAAQPRERLAKRQHPGLA